MGFLAAAFIGIWALVLFYVIFLGQRQATLEQEVRALEEVIGDQNHTT